MAKKLSTDKIKNMYPYENAETLIWVFCVIAVYRNRFDLHDCQACFLRVVKQKFRRELSNQGIPVKNNPRINKIYENPGLD